MSWSTTARGRCGGGLVQAALDRSAELGARTVDLTSRPDREAANRLYLRMGFDVRQTNVYRRTLEAPASRLSPSAPWAMTMRRLSDDSDCWPWPHLGRGQFVSAFFVHVAVRRATRSGWVVPPRRPTCRPSAFRDHPDVVDPRRDRRRGLVLSRAGGRCGWLAWSVSIVAAVWVWSGSSTCSGPGSAFSWPAPPCRAGAPSAHGDDGRVERQATRRAVEDGIAVAEDATVGGHQPVAPAVGRAQHADDRLVEGDGTG